MSGFVQDLLHLVAMIVEGFVHVTGNDLLDVNGPGLHYRHAHRSLDVRILLEHVVGLLQDLFETDLGIFLGLARTSLFVFAFGDVVVLLA